jgi:hypothetical protein
LKDQRRRKRQFAYKPSPEQRRAKVIQSLRPMEVGKHYPDVKLQQVLIMPEPEWGRIVGFRTNHGTMLLIMTPAQLEKVGRSFVTASEVPVARSVTLAT